MFVDVMVVVVLVKQVVCKGMVDCGRSGFGGGEDCIMKVVTVFVIIFFFIREKKRCKRKWVT